MPVSSQIAVWYSKIACSDALAHLRLVRRIRGQELAALQDRVDDRRHVVVVDPGAEERELDARVRVLRGQLLQVADELRLGERRRHIELALEPHASGICSNRSSIEETPIAASISSRSRR